MISLLQTFGFLRRFLGKEKKSAGKARERLRLVLIQDQANISSELLEVLRSEMIKVVSRYLEIDSSHLEMGVERKNGTVALAASIPILRLRRESRRFAKGAEAFSYEETQEKQEFSEIIALEPQMTVHSTGAEPPEQRKEETVLTESRNDGAIQWLGDIPGDVPKSKEPALVPVSETFRKSPKKKRHRGGKKQPV